MDYRSLVFTLLTVGLTVAPPPGPPPPGGPFGTQGMGGDMGGPPSGPPSGQGSPPGGFQGSNRRPGPGGPGGSFGYGDSSATNGANLGGVSVSGPPNQQQQQFGFSVDGQKQSQDQQNKLQSQLSFQNNQQSTFQKPDSQQNQDFLQRYQAFIQQNQPFLKQYEAILQQQQSQKASSNGFSQQMPWVQSGQGYQEQQLGGSAILPGYGYSSSSSFNGYMPHTAGMGYLPSMNNHIPMVIAAPHDFTPFSTVYGGIPAGAGSYGMPQAYAQGAYGNQGSQGYVVAPTGSTQGQSHYTQGLMTPNNVQGTQMYNPVQPSNQKLQQDKAQTQLNGKVQTSQ